MVGNSSLHKNDPRRLDDELTVALIDGYRIAGKEVGYWGRRFLQSVKRNGGLATAKRMLLPRNDGQRKGLDALLEANRPELTVEAVILQERFHRLFTPTEIAAAQERLGEYGRAIAAHKATRVRIFPDELEPGPKYIEGAKKQVRVNAFELDQKARNACLRRHGLNCAVRDFNFQSRYGNIGKGFIHVHHLRPLAIYGDLSVLWPKSRSVS
jgi:5-methylcytosine-specific restriction protein A